MTNVVDFPKPKAQPHPRVREQAKPKFTVINNERAMIDSYLAKNGARKFEPGFTIDYYGLRTFLATFGVDLSLKSGQPFMSVGSGRPRKVSWTEVWREADRHRVTMGLTPILRGAQ